MIRPASARSTPRPVGWRWGAVALCAAAGLAACATTHRPPDAPALFEAQPQQMNWWNTQFYRKNDATYRLRCLAPESGTPARNELRVTLEYAAFSEAWWKIETPDGTRLPDRVLDRSFERCQVFGSLQSMCIYQDALAADVDTGTLAAARFTGLVLTLHSRLDGKHELPLSAAYIDAYLRACAASVANAAAASKQHGAAGGSAKP